MLNWLVDERGIAPHISVFDKSKRDDGTFSRSDFRIDPTDDVYHCPGGKRYGTSGTMHKGKTLLYRASKLGCDVEQSRREKIEMRFAHLKRILKAVRPRLRGPRGAQDAFVLAAIAQNLRRRASLVAQPPTRSGSVYCVA